jgi:hypothetical protein
MKQTESICRRCFHSYVCEQFNEHRDSHNEKCHFFNDHFVDAADVTPVVHGEWVDKPTGRYRQWQSWCSACGKHSGIGGIESNRHKPFCPNCGCKMDGGNHETD